MFKNRHKILILTKRFLISGKLIQNLTKVHPYSFSIKALLMAGFMTFSVSVRAQKTDPEKIILSWKKPDAAQYDGSTVTFLNFEGATFNFTRNRLPFYAFNRSINGGQQEHFTLEQEVFVPFTAEELQTDLSDIKDVIEITEEVVYQQKKPLLQVFFNPVRRNIITGNYEKLVSAKLVSTLKSAERLSLSTSVNRNYAASSVLANGDWFKIAVTNEGIYKVTYSFLANMGVDMNAVTLQNIRLYGNGGGMVPQLNSDFRHDDLQENAIEVSDANGNGIFDTGDYFLFYGQSPDRWTYTTTDNRYHHQRSLYSDSTFYFITFSSGGNAKRISNAASLSPSATDRQITSFTDYAFHEKDDKNFLKSGREWYGETFDLNLNQHFLFSFPGLIAGTAYIKSSAIARTTVNGNANSYFKILANGAQVFNQQYPSVGTDNLADHAVAVTQAGTFNASGSDIDIEYQFTPYNSTSIGWLNFIELNVQRNLLLTGNELFFRNYSTALTNASYTLIGSSAGLSIWNISDPLNIVRQEYTFPQAGSMNFIAAPYAGGSAEFVAFNSFALKQPVAKGRIPNQNLHSLPQADYVIITSPEFTSEAERLADFHRTHSNLQVAVASVDDIYNEYSSGAKDISAIRDFTKMFYDRSAPGIIQPRYVLLFGDASYDYKDRLPGNTDFVPAYQSAVTLNQLATYVTDDFFGYMDDTEGDLYLNGIIDLGVGRLPVKNVSEAKAMVDKIITYSTPGTASPNNNIAANNSRLGDWRNVMCFVADDQDYNLHLNQSEDILNILKNAHPEYNYDKINFDSYQQVSTPGGKRYPEVNELISRRVEKGALLINYTGHGGEVGWAHEKVLTIPMINSWKNINNLPAFVTATCEFTRYDDPSRTSAGELLMLNPDGGGACLFTTSRVAFASTNKTLNIIFVNSLLTPVNNELPRIGDIQRKVKASLSEPNFILVGDPAMRLAYPKYKVATSSILESVTQQPEDTMQALSRITVKGIVTDNAGQKLSSFNGVVYPTIYDKEVTVTTLQNDGDSNVGTFKQQKNIIYRGKASVTNGDFNCSFIVPRDIAYQYGKGRLSYYANDGTVDANGYDESFYIGGLNAAGLDDSNGPKISLYLNSEDFVFGGLTDEKPNIYAILSDSSGINTVGNGIGHDLSAVLDGNQDKVYILNDYYESDLNNYQQGRVFFPLEGLSPGRHALELKAWDINNNSSKSSTEFVVAESAELALAHVLNYPNPFTTHTTFMFEHNKPLVTMWVQVQVFTVTGKLVKTLDEYVINSGFRNTSIEWDGKDDFGDRIGKGVYVYRVKVRTADGETADKYERLVVLK
jgi:Peptidase family C25